MTGGADRFANVSAAVLTGGASTRMGRDKANLPVAGAPTATRIAGLLAELFEQVLLVGGSPPADAPGRRVADLEGPTCALRGIAAALEAATTDRVVIVATDLPLLTPDLVLALVAWPEADAVVPRTDDGLHPLCAIYRREVALEAAKAGLEAGRLKLTDWLDGLETSVLERQDLHAIDPTGTALTNVNTPEDLRRAEGLLAATPRDGQAPAGR